MCVITRLSLRQIDIINLLIGHCVNIQTKNRKTGIIKLPKHDLTAVCIRLMRVEKVFENYSE